MPRFTTARGAAGLLLIGPSGKLLNNRRPRGSWRHDGFWLSIHWLSIQRNLSNSISIRRTVSPECFPNNPVPKRQSDKHVPNTIQDTVSKNGNQLLEAFQGIVGLSDCPMVPIFEVVGHAPCAAPCFKFGGTHGRRATKGNKVTGKRQVTPQPNGLTCHSCASRNPVLSYDFRLLDCRLCGSDTVLSNALQFWIPAFAGMTPYQSSQEKNISPLRRKP